MKTLSELKAWAAENKMYVAEDIPADCMNGHTERTIKREMPKIPDFFVGNKNYIVAVFWFAYDYSSLDGTHERGIEDHCRIIVLDVRSEIVATMSVPDRFGIKNTYTFHIPQPAYKIIRSLSCSVIDKAIEGINMPNKIGVFSEKKVQDWLKYVRDYHVAIGKAYADVCLKNAQNKLKIGEFIAQVGQCEAIEYGNSTTIDTKHFRVVFRWNTQDGTMFSSIEYRGTIEDIISLEKGK